MERYESLGAVGEGSYGTVLKCRHRQSGRLVAIKKFVDSDDDKTVKKIALREIRLLRQLRHENLVTLLEVWKRRRRWYLVFEFVERTLLDHLEQNPGGLEPNTCRRLLYQVLRAAAFCHLQDIIHRDIKPENVLITQGGVVKLCDFGFARTVASPPEAGAYTDYVATRWYRAPELLVGDVKYGKPVDVWAIGCLLMEMLTGQPLFPGDSDLDQIHHIVRCFGNLTRRHEELFHRNPVFSGVRLPECPANVPLQQRFPAAAPGALDLAQSCLQVDPERRARCCQLLEHPLFTQDSFHVRFLDELNANVQKGHRENSTLPKITKTPRPERDEVEERTRRGRGQRRAEDPEDGGGRKAEKPRGKAKLPKTLRNEASTKQHKSAANKAQAQTAAGGRSKQGRVAVDAADSGKSSKPERRRESDTRSGDTNGPGGAAADPGPPPPAGGPKEVAGAAAAAAAIFRAPSGRLSSPEGLLSPKASSDPASKGPHKDPTEDQSPKTAPPPQKDSAFTPTSEKVSGSRRRRGRSHSPEGRGDPGETDAPSRPSTPERLDDDGGPSAPSSPPPPPPPPSSTPLVPPLPLAAAGFPPGPVGLRCLEKRHQGAAHSRHAHSFLSGLVGGSFSFQAPERSLTCERSFLSDCGGAKNKPHVHFPDLRRSVVPEVRSREGRHSKASGREQRRDKHPLRSSPEPPRLGPDGADG